MAAILADFAAAGIPQVAVAELIDDIGGLAEDLQRRGPGRHAADAAAAIEFPQDEAGDHAAEPPGDFDWQALDDLLCGHAWEDDSPMAEAA